MCSSDLYRRGPYTNGLQTLLSVALWVLGHRLTLKFLPAVVVLVALQTVFVAGIGLALSALNVYLRDLSYLTNLGLMAWMYLTPVIYSITLVPVNGWVLGHRWPLRRLIRLNPMTRFVGAYRECLYDLKFPSIITWAFLVISSALTLLVGSLIFRRLQGRFAEEL